MPKDLVKTLKKCMKKKTRRRCRFSKRQNTWAVIKTSVGWDVFQGIILPCFRENSKKPWITDSYTKQQAQWNVTYGFWLLLTWRLDSTKLGQACWYRVIGTCFYLFLKSFTIEVYIYIYTSNTNYEPTIDQAIFRNGIFIIFHQGKFRFEPHFSRSSQLSAKPSSLYVVTCQIQV